MTGPAKPLRVGMCGSAYWAETVHLPALKNATGLELAGLFGRNQDRISELAHRFRIRPYERFEDLLDAVDIVSFAVPPAVQAKLALQAAQAGKHIIVEKPLALGVDEAEAIEAAVTSADLGAVCFLTRDFISDLQDFTAQAVAASPRTARAIFFSSVLSNGSPYAESEWRKDRNATLWDIGPHLLSSLMSIFGPADSVSARRTDTGGIAGILYHSSGKTSDFEANQRVPFGRQELLTVETAQGQKELNLLQYDRVAAFGRALNRLARAIAGDNAARKAFGKAVDVVRVLSAAERSLEACGTPQEIQAGMPERKSLIVVPGGAS
ncbi:Gfo/Idh/MocA family protein [Shumkonia mesophila]|uniref:Gfo/Idh/MocA family protein n=1 Tax=Shumkonia mesophila TaxID=2838854 RepID=UPI00293533B5|nr:Gfo/Idh/MocA family oxidoreductase [Shumkonia mesophila]